MALRLIPHFNAILAQIENVTPSTDGLPGAELCERAAAGDEPDVAAAGVDRPLCGD